MHIEHIDIAGPAGRIESIVESSQPGDGAYVAVICHPHPQQGGTMTNKVVHMLAKSFNQLGAISVRFNYRGVGRSEGTYDEGLGETNDALAVVDWAQQRWPKAQLWIGGFSFGGVVAARIATQRSARRLVTVAPAIQRLSMAAHLPDCPWLLVQGDNDELVDVADIRSWVATLQLPPEVVVLPGVGHFFHGRLNELRDLVVRWVSEQEGKHDS